MRALAPASYDAHLFTLEVGRASCFFARTLTCPCDRRVRVPEQDQTARQGTRGEHLVLLMAPESLYSVRVYAHALHDNRAPFWRITIASAGGRSQWNAKMDDVGALYDTIMFVTIPEISFGCSLSWDL